MKIDLDAKFAFVVAAQQPCTPGDETGHRASWRLFVDNIRRIEAPPAGMQTIHENIWLIPLANGLPFLADLIRWSTDCHMTLRILFLEEVPNWLIYPPDAEKTAPT
jgi:hypothetical protein